jgi:hypothetical protein
MDIDKPFARHDARRIFESRIIRILSAASASDGAANL